MEIVEYLINLFIEDHMIEIFLLFFFSLGVNILVTNVITYFNSTLINSVQNGSMLDTVVNFKYFMFARVFTALFILAYKFVQDVVLSDLRQWTRHQLIQTTFKTNNEDFSNINFTKLSTPINRLANTFFLIVGDTLNYTIPYAMFVFVSIFYFFYQNVQIGILFLIGNLLWMMLLYFAWPMLRDKNIAYEDNSISVERHMVENLNNIDKIITRGQLDYEEDIFTHEKDVTIESQRNYYYTISVTKFVVEMITLLTMFLCIGYTIHLTMQKKLTTIQFISIVTLLFVFKERMNATAALVSDAIEQYGRLEAVVDWFKPIEEKLDLMSKKYEKTDLLFEKVKLDNVTFQYTKDTEKIFNNTTIEVETKNNKIIGIVGQSGKGKSTFVKLLLKLYNANKGTLFIDETDIKDINPDYLRTHITYVNQNSRLFDKTVLDNILYGCDEKDECKKHYDHILTYPKIQNLYSNVDLKNSLAGYSGENLSGGQRQVVNLIGGLINPSKILILDEPTNALDRDLKLEILDIIKYFKPYKQCILIITHDKDVYEIFDEQLKL